MIEVCHANCAMHWDVSIDVVDTGSLQGVRIRHDDSSTTWFVDVIEQRNGVDFAHYGDIQRQANTAEDAIDALLTLFAARNEIKGG